MHKRCEQSTGPPNLGAGFLRQRCLGRDALLAIIYTPDDLPLVRQHQGRFALDLAEIGEALVADLRAREPASPRIAWLSHLRSYNE